MTASLPEAASTASEWPIVATLPVGWLLENGSPAVRARAALELARVGDPATVGNLAYAHAPALRLAVSQRRDGTWNGAMLATPPVSTDSCAFRHIATDQRPSSPVAAGGPFPRTAAMKRASWSSSS